MANDYVLKRQYKNEFVTCKIYDEPYYNVTQIIDEFTTNIYYRQNKLTNLFPKLKCIQILNLKKNNDFGSDGEYGSNNGNYYGPRIIFLDINPTSASPIFVLFHEFGHFLIDNFNRKQIQYFKEYFKKHTKFISLKWIDVLLAKYSQQPKSSLHMIYTNEMTRLYLSNLQTELPKCYYIIEEYLRTNRTYLFTKLESSYNINENEIFCEIFASYMMNSCIHEENIKFVEEILKLNSYEDWYINKH